MKKLFLTFWILTTLAAAVPVYALTSFNLEGIQQSVTGSFCNGGTCTYTPLEPLPGQPASLTTGQQFGVYLGTAFKLFIVLGGMLAVGTFVFGGISYMVSDIVDKKDWARRKMQAAIWALLLLLASYLILNTINPSLTNFNCNLNPLSTQKGCNVTPQQAVLQGGNYTLPTKDEMQAQENKCQARVPACHAVNVVGGYDCACP